MKVLHSISKLNEFQIDDIRLTVSDSSVLLFLFNTMISQYKKLKQKFI